MLNLKNPNIPANNVLRPVGKFGLVTSFVALIERLIHEGVQVGALVNILFETFLDEVHIRIGE